VRLFEEARNGKHAPPVAREKPAPVAGTKVWDMEKPSLSVRALNILKSCEIENIEQLSACTRNDLLRKRHMGPVTLKEIEAFLKAHGSHLAE
jgi:DNA-directed RNA polymerase alpha subunit